MANCFINDCLRLSVLAENGQLQTDNVSGDCTFKPATAIELDLQGTV
jgi:hypothetical protein